MKTITGQSRVTLHYRISIAGEGEFDSTFGGEPMTFTLGEGVMGDGLEASLIDLEEGEHETFELQPDDAFGYPDTDNIHSMPRSDFPPELALEAGVVVGFAIGEEEEGELPGMLLEVGDETVLVDFNHPLAGRTLWFEVKVLKVEAAE